MSHHFLKGANDDQKCGLVYCVTWSAGIGAGNLEGVLRYPDAWQDMSARAAFHELLDTLIRPHRPTDDRHVTGKGLHREA